MSNLPYEKTPEPDILQLNMETISKELNDLIVGGEMELGMMTQHTQQHNFINPPTPAATNGPIIHVNDYQVPQFRMTHYYQQAEQVLAPPPGLSNMTPNLNHMATYQQPILGSAASKNTFNNSVQYAYISPSAPNVAGTNIVSHSTLGPSVYAQSCAYGSPPKYEFHYLKPQDNDKTNIGANPFHTTIARDDFGNRSTLGAYRKYQRPSNKHYNNRTINQCLDYDKIVVDLSLLGWSQDGKEINPVLRIFALLRNLYNAVAEVPPSFEPLYDSEYEPTFAPLPKSRLPRTMNVQYQVKQACRKVTIFVCEMERLLNANKMYDHNLYAETELYLIHLRQLLTQFEMYKRLDLEHKRGQFIKEDVKVHAENLEQLLEHINRQIREVHIRIIACDWFIGITYRGEGHKAEVAIDGPSAKRSKIGVLNEIIQLCNTTTITPTNNTTITATTTSITAAEFSNIKKEFAMVTGKSQNNKIFDNLTTSTSNLAAADSGGLQTNVAATFNTRQPVFYIG